MDAMKVAMMFSYFLMQVLVEIFQTASNHVEAV